MKFCSQKCRGLSRIGKPSLARPRVCTEQEKESARQRMLGNKYALGYTHTDEAKRRMSLIHSDSRHHDWKGDNASYSAIHKWLVNNFGPANKCENKNCFDLPSFRFEYALIGHGEHTHDRQAYVMLCIPCHRSYDSRRNKLRVKL